MPVFMMKRILPNDEYLKWISYFTYKTPDVQEQQMAILMTMIASGLGSKTKPKVTDYLLSHTEKPKAQQYNAAMLRSMFKVT